MTVRLNQLDYTLIAEALHDKANANTQAMKEAAERNDFDNLQGLALQNARLKDTLNKIKDRAHGAD